MNNNCTLRTFLRGVKPTAADWWYDNNRTVRHVLTLILTAISILLAAYVVICVLMLFKGTGSTLTSLVGVAALSVLGLAVIVLVIRWFMSKIKNCCDAGRNLQADG